jgi:hypothetical protein
MTHSKTEENAYPTNGKNPFVDIYNRQQTREDNPELYNKKEPIKRFFKILLIFLVSTLFPVLGLIFYGIWRDDDKTKARMALFGFWINFIFAAYSIFIRFLFS